MYFPHGPNILHARFNHRFSTNQTPLAETRHHHHNRGKTKNKNIFLVVPFTRGLSKGFKQMCNSLGIQIYFKGSNTISTLSMAQKDKDTIYMVGVRYQFECTQADCEEEYIGETGRTFGDRLKEHTRAPFPIYQHSQTIGHPFDVDGLLFNCR